MPLPAARPGALGPRWWSLACGPGVVNLKFQRRRAGLGRMLAEGPRKLCGVRPVSGGWGMNQCPELAQSR